jgi:hypothetical protein
MFFFIWTLFNLGDATSIRGGKILLGAKQPGDRKECAVFIENYKTPHQSELLKDQDIAYPKNGSLFQIKDGCQIEIGTKIVKEDLTTCKDANCSNLKWGNKRCAEKCHEQRKNCFFDCLPSRRHSSICDRKCRDLDECTNCFNLGYDYVEEVLPSTEEKFKCVCP